MKKLGMWTLALCMSVGTIGLVGCGEKKETTPAPAAGGAADGAADAGADAGDTTDATTDDAAK